MEFFAKFTAAYAAKVWVKWMTWTAVGIIVSLLGATAVQAIVIRKYKRTIARLRVATIQLKVERDNARIDAKIAHRNANLKKIKGDNKKSEEARKVLKAEIKVLTKKQEEGTAERRRIASKLKDKSIEALLKSSIELTDSTEENKLKKGKKQ